MPIENVNDIHVYYSRFRCMLQTRFTKTFPGLRKFRAWRKRNQIHPINPNTGNLLINSLGSIEEIILPDEPALLSPPWILGRWMGRTDITDSSRWAGPPRFIRKTVQIDAELPKSDVENSDHSFREPSNLTFFDETMTHMIRYLKETSDVCALKAFIEEEVQRCVNTHSIPSTLIQSDNPHMNLQPVDLGNIGFPKLTKHSVEEQFSTIKSENRRYSYTDRSGRSIEDPILVFNEAKGFLKISDCHKSGRQQQPVIKPSCSIESKPYQETEWMSFTTDLLSDDQDVSEGRRSQCCCWLFFCAQVVICKPAARTEL